MTKALKSNKFFVASFVALIVLGGMTFGNLPGPSVSTSIQTVNGTTFNLNDYGMLDHEMLGLFNYLDTLVSSDSQGYGEWDGWNAENFHGLHHYVLAFMAYATGMFFETTPGYRSAYYQDFAYDLIKKMNTTEDEWGTDSIEYKEWTHPSYNYVDYYWPDASDDSGLYTGGFRGPTNIMWTGHYALMELLYERNFNTGELTDELSWYVDDWNNSLLTDGYGNPQDGGIWEVGLIPCEPYIVFTQCNSIPILMTELYDNLYETEYMEGGMWDYGLDTINNVMQDQYGLFTDGYYVQNPTSSYYNSERVPDTLPGSAISLYAQDGRPKVSSYCNGWALAFLEYTQENETLHDYPIFLENFMKDMSGDMAYIIDTYNNPGGFGTYDLLGSMFTMHLAKQMGDYVTRDRLVNFLFSSYNKIWSADGRAMHYDTRSLEPFLESVLGFGYIFANADYSIKDLADARPVEFWNYPYISSADDDSIWVYQAEWDSAKEGFVLNIKVDQTATLTFSNFDSIPTAFTGGITLGQLTASGGDYILTLEPGVYHLVIM